MTSGKDMIEWMERNEEMLMDKFIEKHDKLWDEFVFHEWQDSFGDEEPESDRMEEE